MITSTEYIYQQPFKNGSIINVYTHTRVEPKDYNSYQRAVGFIYQRSCELKRKKHRIFLVGGKGLRQFHKICIDTEKKVIYLTSHSVKNKPTEE